MNGKQLKNSILQWAIEGKLVPQDPKDEPASVLLEKIRQEKERLIKEKKIKRDKNESIIYRGEDNSYYEKFLATGEIKCIDDEIPFEIPATWVWARFSTIINMSPTVSAEDDVDVAFMPMALINAGYGSRYSYEIKKWSLIKTGFTKLAVGDIAFAKITPCFQNRKSFILEDVPGKVAAATTELNVLRLYGQTLYAWYVLYFLKSDYFIKEAKYKGTAGQQRVLSSYVQNKLFPISPYNEQYRITEKIQEIFPVVDKYEKSQKELGKLNALIVDKLKKSILQEAIQGKLVPQIAEEGTAQELLEQIKQEKLHLVKEGKLKKSTLTDSVIYKGDDNKYFEKIGKIEKDITDEIPFEIPATWQWVRIKDIFQINPKNIANDNCISAFISMEKICATYGSEFSYDEVLWKTIKTGYTHFADGDVAFAKITPCFQNRKSAIFCNLPNGVGAGTTELKVLRQFGETINRWYLLFFLESPYFIDEATFKGTANQQRITSGYLENKLFPLPPLQEQDRIEKQIKAIASIMRG